MIGSLHPLLNLGSLLLAVLLGAPLIGGKPLKVLAIGDSITKGVVSSPTGTAFVDLVAAKEAPTFEIVNIGCGGALIGGWRPDAGVKICLGRFGDTPIDYWDSLVIPNLPAEFAVVMLGTNDASLGTGTGIYAGSLSQIVDGLLSEGIVRIILIAPPPHYDATAEGFIEAYAPIVAAECAGNSHVTCAGNPGLILATDFQASNVHPNATGHAKIAAIVETALDGFK